MIKCSLKIDILLISIILYLYIFQNALEQFWDGFSYYDEIIALIGLGWCFAYFLNNRINKKIALTCILLVLFCIVTLTANIVYEYQIWKAVLIDFFTNIKFFGNIGFGFMVAQHMNFDYFIHNAKKCVKISTIFLLICTVFDVLRSNFQTSTGVGYHVFALINKLLYPDTQYLYQTKKLTLFYLHSTYLSAAIVFILVILSMIKPIRKNFAYILICLTMLFLTGRSKAVAFVFIYILLYIICEKMHVRINIAHFITIGIGTIALGWSKIKYFYFTASDSSARSVLTRYALIIAKKYFPLGTGFGTYASDQALKHYSIVYRLFGLDSGETAPDSNFLNDVMWPIIVGQSGILGFICYMLIIIMLLYSCMRMQDNKQEKLMKGQWGTLLGMIYLFISSLGEPTFNNSVSTGIAFLFGVMFWWNFQKKACDKEPLYVLNDGDQISGKSRL